MFQCLRFKITPVTMETSVIVEYDLADGKVHRVEQLFLNEQIASDWVRDANLQWLVKKLERYLAHKQVLTHEAHLWANAEHLPIKRKALAICKAESERISGMKDLELVAETILRIQEELRMILPMEQQKDYKSSRHNVEDLIEFCNWHRVMVAWMSDRAITNKTEFTNEAA